jgi:hypothetical protein
MPCRAETRIRNRKRMLNRCVLFINYQCTSSAALFSCSLPIRSTGFKATRRRARHYISPLIRIEPNSRQCLVVCKRQGKHTIHRFNPQPVCRFHYERWNADRAAFSDWLNPKWTNSEGVRHVLLPDGMTLAGRQRFPPPAFGKKMGCEKILANSMLSAAGLGRDDILAVGSFQVAR